LRESFILLVDDTNTGRIIITIENMKYFILEAQITVMANYGNAIVVLDNMVMIVIM